MMAEDERAHDAAAEETLEAIAMLKREERETFCLVAAAYTDGIKAGQRLEQMQKREETA